MEEIGVSIECVVEDCGSGVHLVTLRSQPATAHRFLIAYCLYLAKILGDGSP